MEYLHDEIIALCKCTNSVLDGELYLHGTSLQDISGIARGDKDVKLQYVIYDVICAETLLYSQRKKILEDCRGILASFGQNVHCIIADTVVVNNEQELQAYYTQYIAEGYEGAMVRLDEPYEHGYNNYHSKYLLKMKPCYDAEYKLVGWTVGTNGKAEGALMLICEVGNVTFNITPAMELDERLALALLMPKIESNGKTYFDNHYAGRQMTVYYDELSDNKVPLRARTKFEFRD
jgi:ATP-dependent DNA ligase